MCWESKNLKIKTAKRNIPVWKIVCLSVDSSPNKCCSFFKNFVYTKDVLETTPIDFEVRKDGIEGNRGFHSYSNKLKWKMGDAVIFVLEKKIPFRVQGFIAVYNRYSNVKVGKFHIPKGYKYAKNKNGKIISSAIVFDNFIE